MIDADAIAAAEQAIRPHIRRTPIVQVEGEDLGSDEGIANAQSALWSALRIAAEPGGAAALAAILSGRYRPRTGQRVAIVISGGNTSAVNFGTQA